MRLEQETKL